MNAPTIVIPEHAVPDTLARILADKYEEVRARAAATPLAEVERQARAAARPRDFVTALCEVVADGRVVAQLLRDDVRPVACARGQDEAERARADGQPTHRSPNRRVGARSARRAHEPRSASVAAAATTSTTLSSRSRSISLRHGSMPARAGSRGTVTRIVCAPLRMRCRFR